MKKSKRIPKFNNEIEEREFWEKHDSTEYIDWKKARKTKFTNLQPSTKTISIRLPESLLADIKTEAKKRDIPYQSFMKVMLDESISELRRKALH